MILVFKSFGEPSHSRIQTRMLFLSTIPCWRNVIDNIGRLQPKETVYTENVCKNGLHNPLRPYQKAGCSMNTPVNMEANPMGFDFDPSSTTYLMIGHACSSNLTQIVSFWTKTQIARDMTLNN